MSFDNRYDVIDSRDIIKRIEELEEEKDELEEEELAQWEEDNKEELASLLELHKECGGYNANWQHGDILIHESYFAEYCKQFCEDIGDISTDIPDYIVVDWEATADNLRVDYMEVEYNGETYLLRCT